MAGVDEEDEKGEAEGDRAVEEVGAPPAESGAGDVRDRPHDRVGDDIPDLGKQEHHPCQRGIDTEDIRHKEQEIHPRGDDENVVGDVADAEAQLYPEG